MAEHASPAALGLLDDQDFVWNRVWPLVSRGERRPSRPSFELTLHRRREDGRAVAEYRFAEIRVFAKLYADAAEARHVYRIHEGLFRHGFGSESLYRVPESVGYIDENATVLLGPAEGSSLVVTETESRDAFEDGVARAAHWLGALHSSPISLGLHETMAEGMSRLARRASKAAASCPDLEHVFDSAVDELRRRSPASAEPRTHVPTHGRYHAAHVFVTPRCITAIDLDRAIVADPAKDVGEFLHVLRAVANARSNGDEADDSCERFLDEYAKQQPAVLSGLSFYWSYSVLWTLLRLALKDRPARKGWSERVELLRAEFDAIPRRTAVWLTHGRR